MNFLAQIRLKMQKFLYGRNGLDILSRDLNFLALAIMLLDTAFATKIIYWIGLFVFALSTYRICSRNVAKRANENKAYIVFRTPIVQWFKTQWQQLASKKNYRFFKCTSCHQKLRVPKGKGKIEISCPKCGKRFIKTT